MYIVIDCKYSNGPEGAPEFTHPSHRKIRAFESRTDDDKLQL